MKQWARKYKKCIRCKRKDRIHKGNGLCVNCYDSDRGKTPKARGHQERYRNTHRKEIRERQRQVHKVNKRKLFDLLGGVCLKCGFTDERALQIDHIDGGGFYERKKLKINPKGFFGYALQSVLRGEKKYQLLCANCNWIKRSENKEFYKQERKPL